MCTAPDIMLRLQLLIRAAGTGLSSDELIRVATGTRDPRLASVIRDFVASGRVAPGDLGWEWTGP